MLFMCLSKQSSAIFAVLSPLSSHWSLQSCVSFSIVFRDPSWRNEEVHTERSRTGSESSQQGSTSGRGEMLLFILIELAFENLVSLL